jgi:hypothetical protein
MRKPVSYNASPYWNEITRKQALNKYILNEKFIYICYRSNDSESNALLPMIKLAASRTKTTVFATDCVYQEQTDPWFGTDALNGNQIRAYPTIFFVHGNKKIPFGCVQPTDIYEIMNAFTNFSK